MVFRIVLKPAELSRTEFLTNDGIPVIVLCQSFGRWRMMLMSQYIQSGYRCNLIYYHYIYKGQPRWYSQCVTWAAVYTEWSLHDVGGGKFGFETSQQNHLDASGGRFLSWHGIATSVRTWTNTFLADRDSVACTVENVAI